MNEIKELLFQKKFKQIEKPESFDSVFISKLDEIIPNKGSNSC